MAWKKKKEENKVWENGIFEKILEYEEKIVKEVVISNIYLSK